MQRRSDELKGIELPEYHGTREALGDIETRVMPYLRMVLPEAEFERAQAWLQALRSDECMQEYRPGLVHGDLFYANILVDESGARLVGVIDFENASFGDPAQDLALQQSVGLEFFREVVQAYVEAGGHFDDSFNHRMQQLRLLREMYGTLYFAETNDVREFVNSIFKLRKSGLLG